MFESRLNVGSPSASTQNVRPRALEFEDSSAMDSAPDKGNPAGNITLEEEGPNKGDDLLDSSIHTPPPQSKSPSHFSCHRGWAMGRGGGMRRQGAEMSIQYYKKMILHANHLGWLVLTLNHVCNQYV